MKTKRIILVSLVLLTFFSLSLYAKGIELERGCYKGSDPTFAAKVDGAGGKRISISFYKSFKDEYHRSYRLMGQIKKGKFTDIDPNGKKIILLVISPTEFLDTSTGIVYKLDKNLRL